MVTRFRALSRRFASFALVLAVILTAVSLVQPASAAGLFVAAGDATVLPAGARTDLPMGAVRSRLVRIDLGEVARHIAPLGRDRASTRVAEAGALDGVVEIELFSNAGGTFTRTDIDTVGDSGFAWTGTAPGAYNTATLIIDAGQVTGAVQLAQRNFRIDPVVGTLHRITEISRARLPQNENDYILVPSDRPEGAREFNDEARAATQIRVLFAYTLRAKNQGAGIVNEIKLSITLSNNAYNNTNIPIKLILAGTMQTGNYNEGVDTGPQWSAVLSDLSGFNAPGTLNTVRTKRNQVNADLVALVVRNSLIYCGLAWAPEFPGPGTAIYGFSENSRDCLTTTITIPHELGHNMGLFHDRKTNGGNPPNSKYNFGYINDNADIIDIMAYQSSCVPSFQCTQVHWFSTPNKRYPGNIKIGVAQGNAGAADATRRLRETRDEVAAYR